MTRTAKESLSRVLLTSTILVFLGACANQSTATPAAMEAVPTLQSSEATRTLSGHLTPTPPPASTVVPTWTPEPTPTPAPTWTPEPTPTPESTPTPTFTPTPLPTSTPEPTLTPQPPTPTPTPIPDFIDVAVGDENVCGLREDGSVLCWEIARAAYVHGLAIANALAIEDPHIPEGTRLTTFDAGRAGVCGVTSDANIVCWDWDGNVRSSSEDEYTAVSVGSFICALRLDGVVGCSGSIDPPAHERFVSVSAGEGLACGLRDDGFVVCWGLVSHIAESPEQGDFTAVSVGGLGKCGLKSDGSAECWGSFSPDGAKVRGGRLTALSVGKGRDQTFACGLADNENTPHDEGLPWCWGFGWDGEQTPPQRERYVAISVTDPGAGGGAARACGLREDGVIVCWGDNHYSESHPPLR